MWKQTALTRYDPAWHSAGPDAGATSPGGKLTNRPADSQSGLIETDDEGYLIDPAGWNEDIAGQFARQEGLVLGEEHWKIIRYMRNHYDEHHTPPDARHATKFVAETLGYGRKAGNRLFELLPYGYVKQACKIAGMKRPRAWSTG